MAGLLRRVVQCSEEVRELKMRAENWIDCKDDTATTKTKRCITKYSYSGIVQCKCFLKDCVCDLFIPESELYLPS